MKTRTLTADRFWDPPKANGRLTLESLVDRLTTHVESQIVLLLGTNALLRLQIEDKARLHRDWPKHEGRWVPDSLEEEAPDVSGDPTTPRPVKWLRVCEAAKRVGANEGSLHDAARKGRVRAYGVPRRVLLSDVERWHREGKQFRAGQRRRYGHELRTT